MLVKEETKTYLVIESWEEALAAIADIKEYFRVIREFNETAPADQVKKTRLGFDLETYNESGAKHVPNPFPNKDNVRDGRIRLMQLGLEPSICDRQYLIDFKTIHENDFPEMDIFEYYIMFGEALRELLESVTLVGQYLQYDLEFTIGYLDVLPLSILDTQKASQVLTAGDKLSHKLGDLYRLYIPFTNFKELTGKTFDEYYDFKIANQESAWGDPLVEDQYQYAADDVRLIFTLLDCMCEYVDEFIEKHERKNKKGCSIINVIKLECSIVPVFALMELYGIKYNADRLQNEIVPLLTGIKAAAEKEVGEHFNQVVTKNNRWCPFFTGKGKGEIRVTDRREAAVLGKFRKTWEETEVINIGSHVQIKTQMEKAGLPVPDAQYETLIKYRDKHPAILPLLTWKKAEKILNTYTLSMLDFICGDGRIRPRWHQIGNDEITVDTGRSACSGPNMQNQPSRGMLAGRKIIEIIRGLYEAEEGYDLVAADVSNMEVRLMAQRTKDPILLSTFNEGKDMHSITAKEALGLDYYPDDTDPLRKLGKLLFLAWQYRAGAERMCASVRKDSEGEFDFTVDDMAIKKARLDELYVGVKELFDITRGKVNQIFEGVKTLARWASKKPGIRPRMYVEQTPYGRQRSWHLKPEHEKFIDSPSAGVLDKNYLVRQRDGRQGTFGNMFSGRQWSIATEAFNFGNQGSAADVIKIAMFKVFMAFIENGLSHRDARILLQVHDELVVECKKEHTELVKQILHDQMKEAGEMFITEVPVVISVKSGRTWADTK
jgi:DNA polymerase I-like protein with 3'-5' exonuclease and polymerase domains